MSDIYYKQFKGGNAIAALTLRLEGINKDYQSSIRHALRSAAFAAQKKMFLEAPYDERSTHYPNHLRDSIKVVGAGEFNPPFAPGGVGGGGTYQVAVTAGEGVPYFGYVWQGVPPTTRTRRGTKRVRLNQRIYDAELYKRSLGYVGYEKMSGVIKTESDIFKHKGQPAQKDWFYNGEKTAKRVLKLRMNAIHRRLFGAVG